jgi:hypothetical protein
VELYLRRREGSQLIGRSFIQGSYGFVDVRS